MLVLYCTSILVNGLNSRKIDEVERMRGGITLECTESKRRNYRTTKNKKNTTGRLELMKYCKHLNKHTLHRETK